MTADNGTLLYKNNHKIYIFIETSKVHLIVDNIYSVPLTRLFLYNHKNSVTVNDTITIYRILIRFFSSKAFDIDFLENNYGCICFPFEDDKMMKIIGKYIDDTGKLGFNVYHIKLLLQ